MNKKIYFVNDYKDIQKTENWIKKIIGGKKMYAGNLPKW